MYRAFIIFSVITTFLAVLFIIGIWYHVRIFQTDIFYQVAIIYFVITGVTFFILLFKDRRAIFAKKYALPNLLLYIFTTPVPLFAVLLAPMMLKKFKQDIAMYRPLSDFRVCQLCLRDGEPLEIIYYSGGPAFNPTADFYYHYLAIHKTTGDTFNILTTAPTFIRPSNKTVRYISNESDMGRILQNVEKFKDSTQAVNLSTLALKDIRKVIYNPKNDPAADNNYATVIGELGYSTEK
jgi:hypothetical protein